MDVTFLSTSDLHGYFFPTDFTQREQDLNFGSSKIKGLMTEITNKAQGPVIKIDNGDFLQGSPLSYYGAKNKQPEVIASFMNDLGYDFGVLGNHEFNYGLAYLSEVIEALNYPILCGNILKADGTYLTGQAYEIIEREGLKIAVLGLVTPYIPNWEQPTTIAGLVFKSAVATATELVPQLRELADIVVVSYHGGFERDLTTGEATEVLTGENEGYQLLNEVAGIDVLLTGHQHREIAMVTSTCAVTQPGDKGKFLGEVRLTIDEVSREITQREAQIIPVTSDTKALLTESFKAYLSEVEDWLDQKIGTVLGDMTIKDPMAARLTGHPYLEFIHHVQMDATGAEISGTALFDNFGTGFGGEITLRDVVTNYIYPNTLAVLQVSGEDLKAALERSASYFNVAESGEISVSDEFMLPKAAHYNYDLYQGIDYTFDLRQAKGQRVTELSYHGTPIIPEQQLEIVINQYRAVGGGDYPMFGQEKIIREVTVDMTELIGNYLQRHPQITAQANTNFKVKY